MISKTGLEIPDDYLWELRKAIEIEVESYERRAGPLTGTAGVDIAMSIAFSVLHSRLPELIERVQKGEQDDQ